MMTGLTGCGASQRSATLPIAPPWQHWHQHALPPTSHSGKKTKNAAGCSHPFSCSALRMDSASIATHAT